MEREEEEGSDWEIDNTVARLGIAEYQVNKLHRFLARRLDRSSAVAFSKRSSTYSFECAGREYRITIGVDTFEDKDKSIFYSLRNVIQSPAFIITSTLCSIIVCLIFLLSPYWTSSLIGTFSEDEVEILASQYSLLLDRCFTIINDDRSNPRSLGALYSTCNKTISQLDEFCKNYDITICEDERIELYLTKSKP